jgi:hypothetical protein
MITKMMKDDHDNESFKKIYIYIYERSFDSFTFAYFIA